MGNETPDFRKGGRPKKFDLDKRTKLIAARVRPDELVAIEGRAAASNLPLSEFVRAQALYGAILVRAFRTLSAIDRHRPGAHRFEPQPDRAGLQHDRRCLSRSKHRVVAADIPRRSGSPPNHSPWRHASESWLWSIRELPECLMRKRADALRAARGQEVNFKVSRFSCARLPQGLREFFTVRDYDGRLSH